jgi:hypothetical protein
VIVLPVTPGEVEPPLSPWNAGWQIGAYLDHVTWRTPGPHFTPLTAVPGEPGASGAGGTGPADELGPPAAVGAVAGLVDGTTATTTQNTARPTSTGR